jgi:dihydropteroate synthase
MLGAMVTHVRGGRLAAGPALLAVAGHPDEAAAAVRAGADLVDLGGATAAAVAEFRLAHPGVPVCTDTGPGDLVRDKRAALRTGALLLCRPAAAGTCGLPAGRLVVAVTPGAVAAAIAAGWAALVDADRAAGLAAARAGPGLDEPCLVAGVVAIAALGSWLGAAIVRTRHVLPVRRALDMTASIAGSRPPARAVRGLA